MMTGKKYAEMRKYAGKFENSLDESDDVDTDWQDLMYRTGMVTGHDVGVAGGTNGGGYSFGAAYYKDQGVVPTQSYTRYSIRGSFDQGVGKYIRLGLTTNTNYNITKGSNIGLYSMLAASPIANPYNEDGTLKRTVKMNSQDEFYVVTRDIVEGLEEDWLSETKGFGTYNNLFAEVQYPWLKGLKYRVNLGLNYRSTKGGEFTAEGVNSTTADTPSTASPSLGDHELDDREPHHVRPHHRQASVQHRGHVLGRRDHLHPLQTGCQGHTGLLPAILQPGTRGRHHHGEPQ